MTAIPAHPRDEPGRGKVAEIIALWGARLRAMRPRGVASLVLAIAIHGVIAVLLLAVWRHAGPAPVERDFPRSITVSVIEPEPAPAPEPPSQTAVDREPTRAATPPPGPARPEPSPNADQRAQAAQPPQPAQAQEPSRAPEPEPPAASDILTAEGGQAAFAPDPPQASAALRGVVCSTGSPQMRAAAGCGGLRDGAADRFAAYADSPQAAQIGALFRFDAGDTALTGFTVDVSGGRTPGRIFSQHSHFASGAHAAFGQLPVAERARDPGFGD